VHVNQGSQGTHGHVCCWGFAEKSFANVNEPLEYSHRASL